MIKSNFYISIRTDWSSVSADCQFSDPFFRTMFICNQFPHQAHLVRLSAFLIHWNTNHFTFGVFSARKNLKDCERGRRYFPKLTNAFVPVRFLELPASTPYVTVLELFYSVTFFFSLCHRHQRTLLPSPPSLLLCWLLAWPLLWPDSKICWKLKAKLRNLSWLLFVNRKLQVFLPCMLIACYGCIMKILYLCDNNNVTLKTNFSEILFKDWQYWNYV